MKKEIWIPLTRIEAFKKAFVSLAKKSVKLGVVAPKLTVSDEKKFFKIPHENRIYDSNAIVFTEVPIEKVKCHVEGDIPVLNGWKPIAKIDHQLVDPSGKHVNLVSIMRGNDSDSKVEEMGERLDALMACKPNCDHCKQQRVRNQTFLLYNEETKEEKQVGSTCVDDFLGEKSIGKMINLFDINYLLSTDYDSELRDDYSSGRRTNEFIPAELLVAIADSITRKYGFVSMPNSTPTNPSTASLIKHEFRKPGADSLKIMSDFVNNKENIFISSAKEICAWISSKKPENSYLISSLSLAKREFIDLSEFFQVAIAASWPNSMIKELENKKQSEIKLNEYFGEPKQRGKLKLRVSGLYSETETMFPYVAVTMFDDQGRQFRWKASMGSCPEINIGKTYVLTATIKEHNEYKERKQTQLTRCADFEEVEPGTAAPEFLAPKKPSRKNKVTDELSM
ncbi:hypothetical protein D3C87_587490 [compost metagenome]